MKVNLYDKEDVVLDIIDNMFEIVNDCIPLININVIYVLENTIIVGKIVVEGII